MDINALFPSNFLKASDLQGQARRVTIQSVAVEEIAQGEHKPIAKFSGVPKSIVLNKTNRMILASIFGSETTAWTGKEIELYPDKVPFKGCIVDAIRVRAVPPPAAAPPVQANTPPTPVAPPAPAAPVQAEVPTPAEAPIAKADPNDDINW